MSSDRHERVSRIFLEARRLDAPGRLQYLRLHCAGDEPLKEEVDSLLAGETLADEFFSMPEPADTGPDTSRAHLEPGQMVEGFRLIEVIGHGGMGVVWEAEDTSLGRNVALKFLVTTPDDTDWEKRFTKEAKLLGSLNHPGIATAYGLHRAGGLLFLSMEMIRGGTLAHHLSKGRLPVSEALRIARDIAAALEEAHGYGVNHRDIKPANIMLEEPGGKVKILDFGLAGASVQKDLGTQGGTSFQNGAHSSPALAGTGPYMSPEQLEGHPLGRSVDVWAFGCVLYEMLTGSLAFDHPTVAKTLDAIRRTEPDWQALPTGLPDGIADLLRRCLKKDPAGRPVQIGQVREVLESALGMTPVAALPAPRQQRWPGGLLATWALGLTVTAGVLGLMWQGMGYTGLEDPDTSQSAAIPVPLPADDGPARIAAISPDGSHVVFVQDSRGGGWHLVMRELPLGKSKPLPGTKMASAPFFSPDGQWIGFFQNDRLMKMSIGGGLLIRLCAVTGNRGASWGDDGLITFTPNLRSGLAQVPEEGGTPEALTTLNSDRGEITHRWPHLLPDGRGVLFTVGHRSSDSFDDASVAVHDFNTGTSRILLSGGMRPRFVPPDRLIFARGGKLYTVGLDLDRLQLNGAPRIVLENVLTYPSTGHAYYAIAHTTGDLAYSDGGIWAGDRILEWYTPAGRAETLVSGLAPYGAFSLSPDGKRLAVTLARYYDELWLYDLAGGTRTRLTDGPTEGRGPTWTRDGSMITYATNVAGNEDIRWQKADGTDGGELLVSGPHRERPSSWHPDGQTLAYVEADPTTGSDIHLLVLGDEPTSMPFRVTGADERSPRFSPDGTLIAYLSDETGRHEAYVETYPEGDGRIQVSDSGAVDLRWNGKGDRLYFLSPVAQGLRILMAAYVSRQPGLSSLAPQEILEGPFMPVFDVDPLEERFLMARFAREQLPPSKNWLIHDWHGGRPGR